MRAYRRKLLTEWPISDFSYFDSLGAGVTQWSGQEHCCKGRPAMDISETLKAIDNLGAKLKDLTEQHRQAMAAADVTLVNRLQEQIGDLTRQKQELMTDFPNKGS
jgi:hypothetical protein